MNKPAAISADYVDLKFIKTRKVCQIVLECPIEQGSAFVAAFGTPLPDRNIPVAIAMLDMAVLPGITLREQLKRSLEATKPKGGALARRAGILCGEGSFATFLATIKGWQCDPATAVRKHCWVSSRANLDHDHIAGRKFLDLVAEYEAWRLVA